MSEAPRPHADDDEWSLGEGQLGDHPCLTKFRPGLLERAGDPGYAKRLQILWAYGSEGSGAMPDDETSERLKACEDDLVRALEDPGVGILTHATLCDGLRLWYFYCRDVSEAGERLNEVLPHDPPYPIELEAADDPEWSLFRDVVAAHEPD